MTPEHIHLAVNHVPLIGAALSILPLAWGLLRKSPEVLLCGNLMALVTSWATPVVMSTGEAAYDRYHSPEMQQFLDPEVYEVLEHHEHRAHDWSKLFYLNGVLGLAALGAHLKKKEWVRFLSILLLVSCSVCVGAGIWIAESGGKIRRVDFRTE